MKKVYHVSYRGWARILASTSIEAESEKEALQEAQDRELDWQLDTETDAKDVEAEIIGVEDIGE